MISKKPPIAEGLRLKRKEKSDSENKAIYTNESQ
jgi:hypothetical protein